MEDTMDGRFPQAGVPAGLPLFGFQIAILPIVHSEVLPSSSGLMLSDQELKALPFGEEGEVCVSGVGLAVGYLHGEFLAPKSSSQSASLDAYDFMADYAMAATKASESRFILARLSPGGSYTSSPSLPQASHCDDIHRWFRTGDLGVMGSQGVT